MFILCPASECAAVRDENLLFYASLRDTMAVYHGTILRSRLQGVAWRCADLVSFLTAHWTENRKYQPTSC